MTHARSKLLSITLLAGLTAIACRTQPAPAGSTAGEGEGGGTTTAETLAQSATAAEIVDVRGQGGVQSPDLPKGAFLGVGGKLAPGQRVTLPRGTRAELQLTTGQKIRINENTVLKLPSIDTPEVEVESGELVVLCNKVAGMKVRAADELVEVERGEFHLRHAGDTRHYSVVHGKARLVSGDKSFDLGPGASMNAPLAATPNGPDPQPQLSLQPLEDAAWADSFEVAKNLAADVPPGIGSLTARRAGSTVDRQALRLVDQRVKVTITGRVARTEVEQAFHNDASETLEGIYKFPLPADASISSLQLLVGNTWMEGEMLEKQRARQIFREIVDATIPRDPALLQWDQGNVFKLNIFPIPGRGERRIRIAYTQMLPAVGETLRYRYPMVGSGATGNEIENFAFTMTLDGNTFDRAQLANVATPMTEFERKERADGHFELATNKKDFSPTAELGADIPLPNERQRSEGAMYIDRDGQSYFMMSLRPNIPVQANSGRAVDYAVVLDRSHGATPELWTAARGLTQSMLTDLDEGDQYAVLACDAACDLAGDGLRKFDQDHMDEVERFLDGQVLAGASDIGNMLERAGEVLRRGRPDAEKVIVYMGDGAPTSGPLTPDEIGEIVKEKLEGVRVQAIALGARADMLVLDTVISQSGGDLVQADARDDLERLARDLRLRAHVPVARDLALDVPSDMIDVYPKRVPALRPGDTLTVVGRLAPSAARGLQSELRLRGRGPAGPIDESFPVALATSGEFSHAHLPRTWAQEHIEFLTASEGFAAHDEIVRLSRDFNVLSRFTALLVLENDAMFREFGVARKARDKDTWRGELSPADLEERNRVPQPIVGNAQTAPTTGTAPPTPVPTESVEKSKSEEGRAGEFAEAEEDVAATSRDKKSEPSPGPSPDPFANDPSDRPFAEPPSGGGVPGGVPSAPAQASPAEEAEPEPFVDSGDDEGGGANKEGKTKDARKSAGAESAPKKKPSSAGQGSSDGFEDVFGGGGSGGGDIGLGGHGGNGKGIGIGRGWHGGRRLPVLRIRERPQIDSRSLARIDALAAEVARDPTRRSAHGKLVRAAVAAGHPGVKEFAAAWAAADPDHAPALTAHADVLAAAGDPLALRAHASAVEVSPFSDKLQSRLADSLAAEGDFARSCSHRRAHVSIDPNIAQRHADLALCLHEAARTGEARDWLAKADGRVRGSKAPLASASRALEASPAPAKVSLHSFPDVRATLTWSAPVDLDIVVVDDRGRRFSATRPEKIRLREEQGKETLTFAQVSGAVSLEVTMQKPKDEGAVRLPVTARLELQTPTGKKSFDLTFDGPGSQRLARLKWDD